MTDYVERQDLKVSRILCELIEGEIAPGTGADRFWQHYRSILADLAPQNRDLLATRDRPQQQIDGWLSARRGQDWDSLAYRAFS